MCIGQGSLENQLGMCVRMFREKDLFKELARVMWKLASSRLQDKPAGWRHTEPVCPEAEP